MGAAPRPPGRAIVGRTLGDFVVRELIGEGGFGEVYRAEQPALEREAVVKILRAGLRTSDAVTQRFLREARLASKLDHPYAAHIYAFGAEPDGVLWISMELVRGTPLNQLLRVQGQIPLERLVPLLDRICEVVHTAHEQGIVHRDLKPANVMVLSRAGRLLPKLLDFGIAKGLGEQATPAKEGALADTVDTPVPADVDELSDTVAPAGGGTSKPPVALTQRGAVMGSPHYMAPEQWQDAGAVDARADIYALGVLAYEAATGRVPFRGDSITAIAREHAAAAPPPVGAPLPKELDAVFATALAKRPTARYQRAIDLAAAFRAASGIEPEGPTVPQLEEHVREAAIAQAPQPIAEAVAVLESARNAHHAREALFQLLRVICRYLGLLAVACRTRIGGSDSPETLALLRALYRRTLADEEWIALARELVRPFAERRDAYPLPELIDALLAYTGAGAGSARPLDELLSLRGRADEADVRRTLDAALPPMARLLDGLAPLFAYALVVPLGPQLAEKWMGARRAQRTTLAIRGRELPAGQVALLDAQHVAVLSLHPIVQVAPPTPGAPLELFQFDGRGRNGARMVSVPAGFEHHYDALWDWYRAQLQTSLEERREEHHEERAPYRGLDAFGPDDATIFFGREKAVDAFLNRLKVQTLLTVVGRSGAGKSSFVQAGVIPALPEGWRTLVVRPGSSPTVTLRARLAALGITGDDVGEAPLLVVIDQLEELFTLCSDEAERVRFGELLAGLARAPEEPVRVVCTIRDDFLVRAEQLAPLRDRIAQGLQLLTIPGADDLLRILVEPARRAGYELEDEALPREMVAEVADQPGALALLSFTAAQLWERRDRHFKQLTRKAYQQLGGVGGALAQHAERTLEAMVPDQRALVRVAFRNLVTTEGTRAVLSRAELRQVLGATASADAVIERLVDARLVVTSEGDDGHDRVEVVHEALLSAWPRLVEWGREDAIGARLHEQLRSAARQWHERNRARGLLWSGDALVDLQRWRARAPVALTEVEEAFTRASVTDAARRRRWLRGAIGAAFVVLAAGTIAIAVTARRAKSNAAEAEARNAQLNLEQGRQLVLAGDPMRGVVYLEAAYEAGQHGPAIRELLATATRQIEQSRLVLTGHHGLVRELSWSPDGAALATASYDGTARIWDTHDGHAIAELHHGGWVFRAEFSPDGQRVVTASWDGTAAVWDRAGKQLFVLRGHTGRVNGASFSPDGHRIVTAGGDGTVRQWDAATGAALTVSIAGDLMLAASYSPDGRTIASVGLANGVVEVWDAGDGHRRWAAKAHSDGIQTRPRFSPDGLRLVTAGADHTARVWDVDRGVTLLVLRHADKVRFAMFSPDGTRVLTASDDGSAKLWDASSGDMVQSLDGKQGAVHYAEFDCTGERVLTAGRDGTTIVWDAHDGLVIARLSRHLSMVGAAHFDPGCRRVATASGDNTARVWDLANVDRTLIVAAHKKSAYAVSIRDGQGFSAGTDGFRTWSVARGDATALVAPLGGPMQWGTWSHDGRRIAGAAGEVAYVWDAAAPSRPIVLAGHSATITRISFDRNDDRLVTTGEDGTARVWDVASGRSLGTFSAADAGTAPVAALSPDGTQLATSSKAAEGVIRLWDVRTGALARTWPGHATWVSALAFSPDGSMLASGSEDQNARLWTVSTGSLVRTLEGHGDEVNLVAFSPDGERLVTGSVGELRIWEVATGALVEHQIDHRGYMVDAQFSPDGELLATAGDDGAVRVWRTGLEARSASELQRWIDCHVPFELVGGQLRARAPGAGSCN
jgi:WD40 repeat protein/serine/threonine protein kinase